MTGELVSAIITTRDRPDFLAKAAASVLAQTYRPLQLIVVDDGSAQPVTIASLGIGDDFPVTILRNEQSVGVSASRNLGVEKAEGEFVAFLDDDDQWLPEKTVKQVACLASSAGELGGCGCQISTVDIDGILLDEPFRSSHREEIIAALISRDKNIVPSTLMFRRAFFRGLEGYREDMPAAEDCEFLLRFLLHHDFTVLPERLVKFTEHKGMRLTRNFQLSFEGETKYLDFVVRNGSALGANHKVLGYRFAKLGHQAMLAGEWRKGLRNYLEGLRYYPFAYRTLGGMFLSVLGPVAYLRLMSLHMKRLR